MLMRSSGGGARSRYGPRWAQRGRFWPSFWWRAHAGNTGGLLGLLLAVWAKDALMRWLPEGLSLARVNHVSIDGNVSRSRWRSRWGRPSYSPDSWPAGVVGGLERHAEGRRARSSGDLRRNRLRAGWRRARWRLPHAADCAGLLSEPVTAAERLPGFRRNTCSPCDWA